MRSTLQHIQIASYLERGIKDTIHGTLQANRDLDDPDRLQTKMEADLSMFAFGAQLHALAFLSRQDHIACLNKSKENRYLGNSHLKNSNYSKKTINEPVYDKEGNHLGNTKEGFTGKILIYSGNENVDFSNLNTLEAMELKGISTYDSQRSNLSDKTQTKILTNILNSFELPMELFLIIMKILRS